MLPENIEDYTEEQLQELASKITEEEFDQLDELSQKKLGCYMAASSDSARAAKKQGIDGVKTKEKRQAGFRQAGTKWLKKNEDKEETEGSDDESLEETAAADSIKTKSASIADIVHKMSGMKHDDITRLADVLDQIGHEADKLPAGANAEANKNSIKAKGSAVAGSHTIGAVKEDLINIFGEDQSQLSEEIINKTTALFEAAVNIRVDLIREEMYEEASQIVEDLVEERTKELTDKLDDYLGTVVEEWISENALVLESNIRTAKAEAFLEDLAELFEEHNVNVPEGQEDVVESLLGEIDELKDRLDEEIERGIEAKKLIEQAEREEAFDEVTEGLTDTQTEKLRTLVEGIDYDDLDEYKSKVKVIKEQHFKEVSTSNLSDEIDSNEREPAKAKPTGDMAKYSEAISRVIKNT